MECTKYKTPPVILKGVRRIIALGDIHGDFTLAIKMLLLAKVIIYKNGKVGWIGEDTVVVQIGDQIDNCRPPNDCNNMAPYDKAEDLKVLKLFTKLHLKALKHGGAVISIIGNHELINVLGSMNYVSKMNLDLFNNYKENGIVFKNSLEARKYAFDIGHKWGKFIGCTRLPFVIIGNVIFSHAGVIASYSGFNIKNYDFLDKFQQNMKLWLLGDKTKLDSVKHYFDFFWNRSLGLLENNTNSPICDEKVDPILKLLGITHMVIGHTPQKFSSKPIDSINSTCNGSVWRIDNAMALPFNNGHYSKIQVLEILNGKEFNVLESVL